MSAYSASAPVIASTTAPIATNAMCGWSNTNANAYVGDSPLRIDGDFNTYLRPATPISVNQTTITGPNTRPTRCVPQRCTANSTVRIVTAIGITRCSSDGAATFRPSTAE